MAHMLSIRKSGRAEMAYVGKTPWHGLGQNLRSDAGIEEWATAAGMDWTIESTPVHFEAGGQMNVMPDRVVLYRSDNLHPLAAVSTSFQPVHPREVLEFFRDLTDAAGFQLETAGTLFNGKRLWALASIGTEAAIVDPADKMKGYLLLSTACDGSMSTEARYTTIRVVCNNTLGLSRSIDKSSVKVSHRTAFDHAATKGELGIEAARCRFAEAMEDFRHLAETELKPAQALELTAELFHPGFADMESGAKRAILEKSSGPIYRVGELAINHKAIGSDLEGASDTAWGWLNAVTQYVDHETRAHSQDTRLNSAWYGRGADIKQRALDIADTYMTGIERTRARDIDAGLRPELDGAVVLHGILANAAA